MVRTPTNSILPTGPEIEARSASVQPASAFHHVAALELLVTAIRLDASRPQSVERPVVAHLARVPSHRPGEAVGQPAVSLPGWRAAFELGVAQDHVGGRAMPQLGKARLGVAVGGPGLDAGGDDKGRAVPPARSGDEVRLSFRVRRRDPKVVVRLQRRQDVLLPIGQGPQLQLIGSTSKLHPLPRGARWRARSRPSPFSVTCHRYSPRSRWMNAGDGPITRMQSMPSFSSPLAIASAASRASAAARASSASVLVRTARSANGGKWNAFRDGSSAA